jgi:hypothetical protein
VNADARCEPLWSEDARSRFSGANEARSEPRSIGASGYRVLL